jgi:hypothetical protein
MPKYSVQVRLIASIRKRTLAPALLSAPFTGRLYGKLMTGAPTTALQTGGRAAGWSSALASNSLWIVLSVVALAVLARAQITVNADVSCQLWIAHQLNGGVRLYRDIIEVNPPLWFWMAMPVDQLAGLIHVRSDCVLIVEIGCLAALSLAATNRLLGSITANRRALLLVYAALVLVALPWLQFGQREQIALIGTLPYAALIAARRAGQPVPIRLAFFVGVGAAASFALKHYFLLVPTLLELWLLTSTGKKWRPVRAETVAMIVVGISYAAAFLLWAHDYFSVVLPLLRLAYGETGAERFVDLLQPAVLIALATLGLIAAHRKTLASQGAEFAVAMTVAGVGFAAAYFIQAKGWSYHSVPLAGCAAIALAACLTLNATPRLVVVAAPALLCLPFWTAAQQAVHEGQDSADLSHALEGLRGGDSVGFIATDPALGLSVTLQRGFRHPSRYLGFWMMRAIVRNERAASPDPRLTQLGRRIVAESVQDFRCIAPKRIIVARPTPDGASAGEFDILAFFLRDPQFAELLAHYRPLQRTSLETFQLVSPLNAGHDCIRRAEPRLS